MRDGRPLRLLRRALRTATVALDGREIAALAIERLVLCRDERNAGALWVRFEQELYCAELGFRCGLDHRWALLPAEDATPERLAGWRADPAAQRYDGRQVDVLVAAGPR